MSGKKSVSIKSIIYSILALILVFMGVIVICSTAEKNNSPIYTKAITLEKISAGDIVLSDDVSVIAPYMYTEQDGVKTVNVLVSFSDIMNRMCVASLSVTDDTDLYDFIERYKNDDSTGLGTYAIKGHFLISEVKYRGEEILSYYKNACEKYAESFEQGSELYYNGEVSVTEFDMKYLCSENEQPERTPVKGSAASVVIGIIIALTGVAGVSIAVYSIIKSVKTKRKEK